MEEKDFYKQQIEKLERAYNIAQIKYTLMERISFGVDKMAGLKKLEIGTKIYIYGAGTIGKFLCSTLKKESNITFLRKKSKKGCILCVKYIVFFFLLYYLLLPSLLLVSLVILLLQELDQTKLLLFVLVKHL